MSEPRFIQLPKVPQTFDERSMRNLMQAVRHNLQQIIEKGISSEQFRTIYLGTVGTGGTLTTPEAPDAVTPVGTPGIVSNLTATGAYSSILLDWTGPLDTGWTHFEVWRAEVESLAEARRWAKVDVEGYSDSPPTAGVPYYYWVRAAIDENFGPWAGPVSAQIVPDFDTIYDGIQDQIFNDPLFTSLGGRVDLIEFDLSAIEGDIASINAQIVDLSGATPFDANTAYEVGDLVTYNGRLYICIQATTPPSPLPTDPAYWDDIGAYSSLGEAVAAHAQQIDTTISDLAAEIIRTDQLYTDVYHATTGLSSRATIDYVDQVEADIYGAAVSAFTQINAALYDPVTGLNATKASITQLNDAKAEIYGAAVSAFTQINAALYDPVTGLESTKASITQLNTAVSDIFSAAVTSFTQINAALYDPVTGLANTKAGVSYVDTAAATAQSNAIATATQQVYTTLGGNQAVVQTKAASWDGTAAQWEVKAVVGDLVGGVGLLNDGVMTRLYVQADRFAVYGSAVPGDPELGVPFVIEGGVTFIKDAMIRNAAITAAKIADLAVTTAKIGDLQVTDAKIASLAVSKIQAGTISVNLILAGSIIVSTNGFIRSGQEAYDTGTGWWLGTVSNTPRFSIGNGSNQYMRWSGSALQTSKLVVNGAEIYNSPLEANSARIHTGGGRTAPFVIYDINQHIKEVAQSQADTTVGPFYGPSYLTGHYHRRLAFQNQDALIQITGQYRSPGGAPESDYRLELSYRTDSGSWVVLRTYFLEATTDGGHVSGTFVRRFTTPNAWDTLDFRARLYRNSGATADDGTVVVTASVFFNNANQSNPVNEATSGDTSTVPLPPIFWEPPPGGILP